MHFYWATFNIIILLTLFYFSLLLWLDILCKFVLNIIFTKVMIQLMYFTMIRNRAQYTCISFIPFSYTFLYELFTLLKCFCVVKCFYTEFYKGIVRCKKKGKMRIKTFTIV